MIVGIACAIVAGGVGLYVGKPILLPLALTIICWFAARWLVTAAARPLAPAIAVQGAQALSIALVLLLIRQLSWSVIDIAFLAGGILWLAMRPGRAPVIVLILYQAITAAHCYTLLSSIPAANPFFGGILITLAFTIVSTLLMLAGLSDMRAGVANPRDPIDTRSA